MCYWSTRHCFIYNFSVCIGQFVNGLYAAGLFLHVIDLSLIVLSINVPCVIFYVPLFSKRTVVFISLFYDCYYCSKYTYCNMLSAYRFFNILILCFVILIVLCFINLLRFYAITRFIGLQKKFRNGVETLNVFFNQIYGAESKNDLTFSWLAIVFAV